VATGRCKYLITDVDLITHQGNDTKSPLDDPVLPEVYTATVACIYNVDGKCKGMLTPERFQHSSKGFWKGIIQRLTWQHPPTPQSCIRTRGPHHTQRCCYHQIPTQARRLNTPFHRCFSPTLSPPYTVTKEKIASPLNHDPTLPQYWSEHPRDKAFGAHCNAFSSKFTGFSICHPIYHENTCILQQGLQFTLLTLAQRQRLLSCFSPPGIKGWPQVPTHRSTTDSLPHIGM